MSYPTSIPKTKYMELSPKIPWKRQTMNRIQIQFYISYTLPKSALLWKKKWVVIKVKETIKLISSNEFWLVNETWFY